jgi:hypothetical protein
MQCRAATHVPKGTPCDGRTRAFLVTNLEEIPNSRLRAGNVVVHQYTSTLVQRTKYSVHKAPDRAAGVCVCR